MNTRQNSYLELLEKLRSTHEDNKYDTIIEAMDGMWYGMNSKEIDEIECLLSIFLRDYD